MQQYYTIINRQDFNSLYRYGQIKVNANRFVSKNGNLEDRLLKLFQNLAYFDYDEEYIIIEFGCEIDIYKQLYKIFEGDSKNTEGYFIPETKKILPHFGHPTQIDIENIENIYVLSVQAQKSLMTKLDNRLNIKTLPFPELTRKIQNFFIEQESKKGTKVFWEICQVEEQYKEFIPFSVITQGLYHRIAGKKSFNIKETFFTHLIVYERYEFYTKTNIGFIYDTGEILANTQGVKSFKNSGLHKYLVNNKDKFENLSLIETFNHIEESEEIKGFKTKLLLSEVRLYFVSAIFLKFKDEIRDKESLKETSVGKQIIEFRNDKKYINELNFAIYLLGGFFGYKKFYDDYYDLVELKIFKQKQRKKDKIKQGKLGI